MKFVRCCAAVAVLALAGSSGAEDKKLENKLPDAVVKALQKADEVVVYSLNGETGEKDGWHGAKDLGNTAVKDADAKKALGEAMKKGVAEGTAGARCFIPRHGLRAKYDGKTYDLLICFECHWVYVYTDNADKPQVFVIADSPQKALNKILTDAKVPLAKPEK
jgi:hypothetical protein